MNSKETDRPNSSSQPYAPPHPADDTAPPSPVGSAGGHGLLPSRRTVGVLLFCAVGIVLARLSGEHFDHAVSNLITQSLLGVAVITLAVWFARSNAYPEAVRWGVILGLPLCIFLAFTLLLRVDEVGGEMWVRKISFRWSPKRDETLGRIVPTAKAAAMPSVNPAANEEPSANPVAAASAETTADFPRYFGRDGSGYLPLPKLARDWSSQQPKIIWKRELGAGWSGFSTSGTLAYTLEQRGAEEWTAAYDIASGEPIWGHAVLARHESVLGGIGPRSTPTVDRGRVFTLGGTGVVQAFEALTGEPLWRFDIENHLGITQAEDEAMIFWGRAHSPLVVDDLIVVAGGGKEGKRSGLIALHRDTGKVVWENGDLQAGYSSPILYTLNGVPQIVYVSESNLTGHDPKTGRELWRFVWFGDSTGPASASQPLFIAPSSLLISKAYGGGGKLLELTQNEKSGEWTVQPKWEESRVLKTKFTSPVIIGKHVYALSDGILECVSLSDGKAAWKAGRYRQGQILGVGESILVQAEDGYIAQVEANPAKFVELGRFDVLEGKTWNNLCLHGRFLLVRNAEFAACVELPLAP